MLLVDHKQLTEDFRGLQLDRDDLAQFKAINTNVVTNINGLVLLFEQAPFFPNI